MRPAGDGAIEIGGIPEFWDAVRTARSRCLILDYDGTLAGFRVDRMRACPTEGVVDLLLQIRDRTDTHLAVMTGRPVAELLHLLGDLRIPVSGSQGTEFRYADGSYQTHEPTAAQEERLRKAQHEASSVAPADRVERKITSVAVHTRGLPPDEARRVQGEIGRAWSVDAGEYDLECREFSGGVELRLRGIDKGTALLALLRQRPEGTLCVYIGDDLTDEDAFRAIVGHGYGIRVGGAGTPTAARGRLADTAAVKEFLKGWLETTETMG